MVSVHGTLVTINVVPKVFHSPDNSQSFQLRYPIVTFMRLKCTAGVGNGTVLAVSVRAQHRDQNQRHQSPVGRVDQASTGASVREDFNRVKARSRSSVHRNGRDVLPGEVVEWLSHCGVAVNESSIIRSQS